MHDAAATLLPLDEMLGRDLDPIRRRHSAATPGTWVNSDWTETRRADGVICTGALVSSENVINESQYDIANCPGGDTPPGHGRARQARADAEFVAHAHEDIPTLVRDVETGRRAIGVLRAEIDMVQGQFRDVDDRLDAAYAENATLSRDNDRMGEILRSVRRVLAATVPGEDDHAQRDLLTRLGRVFAEHQWTVADDLAITGHPAAT